MPNRFFSAGPLSTMFTGIALLRIICGIFMIYHGWEIFDSAKMKEYASWDVIKRYPSPLTIVYAGKAIELVGGILLTLGLFTRIGALCTIVSMLFICFLVGDGRIFTNEQHPFLLALMGVVFFFTGPGKWSADQIVLKKQIY